MEVIQFLESLSSGDAVSHHALQINDFLSKQNIKTRIFRHHCSDDLRPSTLDFRKAIPYLKKRQDKELVLVFHYSIYSEVYELFKTFKGNHIKKILIFHNVTPPEFFPQESVFRKDHLETCEEQIRTFQKIFDSAIADSEFNAQTIREYGFKKKITVIPPFTDVEQKFGRPVSKPIASEAEKHILFVSQFNFHKKQDDIVKIFNIYNQFFNKSAKLHVVGGHYSNQEYFDQIQKLADNNPNIFFPGKVSQEQLVAYYLQADLFLCMSEHEGFAVPIVEAMYFNVPVIAYDAGAVADTMGSGGILVKTKDYFFIAALIDSVLKNKSLLEEIKTNQHTELKRFDYQLIKEKLTACLLEN